MMKKLILFRVATLFQNLATKIIVITFQSSIIFGGGQLGRDRGNYLIWK